MRCVTPSLRLCLTMSSRRCLSSRTLTKAKISSEQASTLPWNLASAVLVERIPTIIPELSDLEKKVLEFQKQVELEKSLKCDHELRHEADENRKEQRKRGEFINPADVPLKTALEEEHEWKKELEAFEFAPRKTRADETNDTRSVHRSLHRPLRLLLQRKLGDEYFWDLPISIREGNESMRDVAEKALVENCGSNMKVQILGNAPWSFYKEEYPRRKREEIGIRGTKVFLFMGHYVEGNVVISKDQDLIKDFSWTLEEEMMKMIRKPPGKSVKAIILGED